MSMINSIKFYRAQQLTLDLENLLMIFIAHHGATVDSKASGAIIQYSFPRLNFFILGCVIIKSLLVLMLSNHLLL